MGYCDYLRALLRPLGVYALEEGYSALELQVIGRQLDALEVAATELERECFLATAEGEGLENWEALIPYRAFAATPESRRETTAALQRIDGGSFTPAALADTVRGSGLAALLREGDAPLTVCVSFPGVRAVPDNFAEIAPRIESILPCHLEVKYVFAYPTFAILEEMGMTWRRLEVLTKTWLEFEYYPY
jgi:hypothetical protein